MIKFNFKSLKGDIYNGIKHDSRLKDIDWSEFFDNENFYIVTHNGQFHADDVFCVALVYILYVLSDRDTKTKCKLPLHEFMDKYLIRESSLNVAIEKHGYILSENTNTIVFDITGGHYDHHCVKQDIPRMSFEDNKIKIADFKYLYKGEEFIHDYSMDFYNLCSFGQLWQHIGKGFNYEFTNLPEQSEEYKELYHKLFDMSVFSKVFKEYVLPISLVDLNGPKKWNSPISRIISNCNREPEEFFGGGFGKAVNIAVSMLFGEINNIQNQCKTLDDVYGKLNYSKPQLPDNEFDRKVKGGGSDLSFQSYRVDQLPSKPKLEPYVSDFLYGKHSYIVIPDGCDVNINLSTLEYIYVRNSDGKITNPLFIFNQNPSTRDGSYRIVFGSRMVLNKQCIDNIGVKYKFCHEAGFMITFETIKDAQDFIESMQLAGSMWNYCSDTCEVTK